MYEGPVWKFKPVAKDDKWIDPIQQEFFTTESVGEPAEALVRESIQNSLDARSSKEAPVRVRIAFSGGKNAIRPEDCREFFENLSEHIQAKDNGLFAPPDLNEPIAFIVVEDFGTKGLQGKPEESGQTTGAEKDNSFFYFWRNVGRSGKGDTDRGRWGLGKAVFPASSQINTFFGLTVQGDSGHSLLMGQAVLKIHRDRGGHPFHPYGDFGLFERKEGSQYFALPVKRHQLLEKFREIFNLQRNNESGLSVVIPAPIRELQFEGTLSAVLGQYFYPVLSRDLVVQIEDPDEAIEVNSATIEEVVDRLPVGLRRLPMKLLQLAKWSLGLGNEDHFDITLANPNAAPSWAATTPLPEEALAGLRKRYSDGERLAFRVWVKVEQKKKKGGAGLSWFDVYLERAPDITKSEGYFIRDGITVTGIRPGMEGGVRGLVVITDAKLATMLGDAENPAHTEWQRHSPKFKGKYEHGSSTLSFVKNSLRELALRLSRASQSLDRDLLKDVFYLERPRNILGHEPNILKNDPGQDKTPEKPILPAEGQALLRVTQSKGGVKVALAKGVDGFPAVVQILFAYGVRRGNPFKRYHRLDFDVSVEPILIDAKCADVRVLASNQIEFKPASQDFELSVSGFDPSRDLVVRTVSGDKEEAV